MAELSCGTKVSTSTNTIAKFSHSILPTRKTKTNHYGAGIEDNDYEIPVMKRGDENESMENDGILIMSDSDDELVTAAPGEEEKEKIVQDVPLSDAGTRAEPPPISFSDDDEVNEVKCHDHDCPTR